MLAHLASMNKVGIIGAKRILTFEYLRLSLQEPDVPYYIKKVYLKYMFEVFMRKSEKIN